jgi:hypothetical protein
MDILAYLGLPNHERGIGKQGKIISRKSVKNRKRFNPAYIQHS